MLGSTTRRTPLFGSCPVPSSRAATKCRYCSGATSRRVWLPSSATSSRWPRSWPRWWGAKQQQWATLWAACRSLAATRCPGGWTPRMIARSSAWCATRAPGSWATYALAATTRFASIVCRDCRSLSAPIAVSRRATWRSRKQSRASRRTFRRRQWQLCRLEQQGRRRSYLRLARWRWTSASRAPTSPQRRSASAASPVISARLLPVRPAMFARVVALASACLAPKTS
mmetsp:Transcript_47740/g.139191  ORF Transcript_47740/g.139191 Transcript_47740/m.139191 type:complete len:227 (-) Transcript_47740:930-1610(-)